MELNRISEEVEKKAKTLWEDNFKKLEEKAQPKIEKIQDYFEQIKDPKWLSENTGIDDLKERITNDSKEIADRVSGWFEEQYSSALDYMGLATKDDVEALRKKISTLQRKVNGIKKSLNS